MNAGCAGETVNLLRTRVIPERRRGAFTTRRCTNPRLPYLTHRHTRTVQEACAVGQSANSRSALQQQSSYSIRNMIHWPAGPGRRAIWTFPRRSYNYLKYKLNCWWQQYSTSDRVSTCSALKQKCLDEMPIRAGEQQ